MSTWSAREVASTGAVIASMVALGWALAGVPNVELVTLTAFIGGWWLGASRGAVAAATGELLFSVANPLGPALPPVLAMQVAGMALAAVAGAFARRLLAPRLGTTSHPGATPAGTRVLAIAPMLGAAGAIVTLSYDALTNAGHAVAMGMTRQMPQVIAAGVAFSVLHIVANAATFAVLGPAALFVVEKRRRP